MSLNVFRIVENNTPLIVHPFHQLDHHGHDTITVVAKLTWRLSSTGQARIAVPQRPVRPLPDRTDDGKHASVKYPDDTPSHKPGTDVIMVASAHPPQDASVTQQDVSLRVETGSRTLHKAVRVFGSRAFMRGAMSVTTGPAQQLEITPITYELAEGGYDAELFEEHGIFDSVNPSGRGCAKDRSTLVGQPAYQIELLGGHKPAGFGAIDGHWEARRRFGGTSDEAYRKRRYPVAPADFDPRFNCAAHPDLWSEEPLVGDEAVEILGATPEGEFRFKLPIYEPRFDVRMFGEQEDQKSHLDTVLIDLQEPNNRLVELTWRLCIRLPKKSEHLEKVVVTNRTPFSKELYDTLVEDLEIYERERFVHVH